MPRAIAEVPTDHPAFAQPADPAPPVSEVQTSAEPVTVDPVTLEPAKTPETPETPVEPVAAKPDEAEADDEGPYFRKKDGTFRKATKKEAFGELHARINTLTGRLRGTEEELQKARTSAPAPEQPRPATVSDPNDPEPELDQFANDADPYKSLIKATAIWATRQEYRAREQAQAEQRARQQVGQTFKERSDTFATEHPDYNEVLQAATVDLTAAMHHVIQTDEQGPAIAYYLAQHPDEGHQLVLDSFNITAAGPQLDALRKLLHVKVAAAGSTGSARPTVRSSAPVPLNPVRTGAPALDEPPLTGDVSFSDFFRRGNEADRKRREARTGA